MHKLTIGIRGIILLESFWTNEERLILRLNTKSDSSGNQNLYDHSKTCFVFEDKKNFWKKTDSTFG